MLYWSLLLKFVIGLEKLFLDKQIFIAYVGACRTV